MTKKPFLYDYQMDAVKKMRNGCILNGGVGSGKSRTGLYYYFKEQGGSMYPDYIPMKNPKDLYIITTAMKRDSLEFEGELANYLLSTKPEHNYLHSNKILIDSWNNIKKYAEVKDAFFIFDEDRVTGSGVWVKSFLKIAKNNDWIILSATPGDTWEQYIPVFVANGNSFESMLYFHDSPNTRRLTDILAPESSFVCVTRFSLIWTSQDTRFHIMRTYT